MKTILFNLIVGLIFSLPACSKNEMKIKSQSATDFKNSIENKSVILIDVRTPEEYSAGHIPNAINVDVNNPDFENRVKVLLKPKNELALYCRSGRRSKFAASKLTELNTIIYELNNGFNDWLQSGFIVKK